MHVCGEKVSGLVFNEYSIVIINIIINIMYLKYIFVTSFHNQ